ncbi:FGGY carbohydrate kinase domain-containing protein-like [Mizuhopecten yessoensis]|uniref:FGGY carbohydrate kinase domain-containing protein n=1 Tax=Mizuhopecten yessoensis TaxID=6573 RepID=A0A210PEK8_MIZYE|nr:FGGY carbohydrate kinase domain-containing protein-like [Mizuhopecten yessoensis]OWF34919.1 FGGY carbohydrate kinase domain-containing protein [Mizuhopecten yessoensis]
MPYYLGVDVGTGSVRSALVSGQGRVVSIATKSIKIWSPQTNHYEQSSKNVWSAVVETVQRALSESGIDKEEIHGIGFDATCSLVVLDKDGASVSVNSSGSTGQDIMMWMDHRAEDQARRINATDHDVLKYVGGTISLEMQAPKLLWLKENLYSTCWSKASHLFDLPDFLTWKATGSLSRSLCSLICKWNYQAGDHGNSGWSEDFFTQISLEDLVGKGYSRIGTDVKPPGSPCGNGLSQHAAQEMGLVEGIPVGTSMIDAHAGALGCMGCIPRSEVTYNLPDITSRLVLVCGTSTCHMIVNEKEVFVPGVWGPFYSSILPGLWCTEGGQSSTGKLIDFIVQSHPAYQEVKTAAQERNIHEHDVLNELLEKQAKQKNLQSLSELTRDLHIWPDFHGNRSPLADPTLKGMICGLTLNCDMNDLAVKYLATIQAIAYGTQHIIQEMRGRGLDISVIYMCGGLRKNTVYLKTQVDVTGLPLILPDEEESVLVGAAMLGACASKDFPSLQSAMETMGGRGTIVLPSATESSYHKKKFWVFLKMVDDQQKYNSLMS